MASSSETDREACDSVARTMNVTLYTREVEMPSTMEKSRGSDPNFMKQWALLFYSQDDSWITAEGFCGGDNKIVPKFLKHAPENKSKYKCYNLGILFTTPDHIREYVFNNEKNGEPYWTTVNNSQGWAKALAKKLDPDIEKKMNNFLISGGNSLEEVDPFATYGYVPITDNISVSKQLFARYGASLKK